ncbi:TRAP transporter permease [Gelria sp. Kuro-4]|uniref:TRAP transporter permease n=1 Tax=Gelria sp. Kuro-4 TaxID=2796927 RepID=UPI001BEED80A|nr:TRAP transporter permease [Gelria sp. Kuro-4]BCV24159.1 C4-dicarboxylate ABC transporter [Gelria sp. Kuro-4]
MDSVNQDEYSLVDTSKIVEEFQAESRFRRYTGVWAKVISVIAIVMSAFHLYTAGFGTLQAMKQRSVHLAFVLGLIFLLYPASRKTARRNKPTWLDILFAVLGIIGGLYNFLYFDTMAMRGGIANNFDYFWGVVTLLLILEAARRCIGKELPLLSLVFVAYGLFGNRIPGIFGHTGFTWDRIVYHLYFSTEGIFGVALSVSATYIFMFILFGAFLGETGMAKFINDISMALAGGSAGGPAKVAIFASALLGTINGSAVANVATTGAFTIPLMKSIGYKPHFAGAVEAVSSTGGQIMPPVMGAAAFVMAEFLGMPYAKIMIAAILPALLYYLADFVQVHFEAVKIGLRGLPRSELPSLRQVLRTRWHLAIPLLAIVYLLLTGKTPLFAAFYGTLITIVASWFKKETRLSLAGLLRAMESGAREAITVAIACAVVGFIVGIVTLTGIGLTIGDNILALAGGNLLATMFLTMVLSIILGMGLPTTACYIVAATVAAPALIKIGVPDLAAHMFVFYYACLANLTPPVALAAYAGAGIAGANPSKTGWTAVRLAIAGFIIPFLFVYSPILLLQTRNTPALVQAIVTAILGVTALGIGAEGYFLHLTTLVERALFFAGAFGLMIPGAYTDLAGLVLVALAVASQVLRSRRGLPAKSA